jgi:hypothetical protein
LGIMSFLSAYYRLLDFALRRIFALMCIIWGSVIALINILYFFPGGQIEVNGVLTSDLFWRIFGVAFPLLFVIIGIVLFKAKPIRPWRGLH